MSVCERIFQNKEHIFNNNALYFCIILNICIDNLNNNMVYFRYNDVF